MSTVVALTHAASASPGSAAVYAGPPRSGLDKARLSVHEPSALDKDAGYEPGATLYTVDFQFNPKELTLSKSAKWPRKPAKGAPKSAPPEFSGSDPVKLSLEMFFDATESHDGSVVESVEKLLGCCVPTADSLSHERPLPPLVVFHWGKITGFASFVSQVSAKYTLFAADGTPIRATCSVSMEEMPGPPGKQNPTSGAIAVHGQHVLVAGDTLTSLAYREYHDPAAWRALADFNQIDDPLRLQQGTVLLLPRRDELPVRDGR